MSAQSEMTMGQSICGERQRTLSAKKVEIELEIKLIEAGAGSQTEKEQLETLLTWIDHELEISKINVAMEIAENMELMANLGMEMAEKMTATIKDGLENEDEPGEEEPPQYPHAA